MPDIDIDFCIERRGEVIDYIKEQYGENSVTQIITFGKMKAKQVVRDVGRVMGYSFSEVDKIAKAIPNELNITLDKALEKSPELKKMSEGDFQELINHSKVLEGMHRHASIHAAGVVISKDKIYQDVPLYSDPESNIYLTQFDMKWVENAGLVKFDFLGLKTLTLIDKCIKIIQISNPQFNIDKIEIEDKKTYELLSTGETTGIFQLESAGMKETLKQLKPDKFEDIIAIVALYRPGPMANIPAYIERKHEREKPD